MKLILDPIVGLAKVFTDPVIWIIILVLMILAPVRKWGKSFLLGIGAIVFLTLLIIALKSAEVSGILPACMGYCP
jgi:cobalamin biosynthesis protein CobD/CbiB